MGDLKAAKADIDLCQQYGGEGLDPRFVEAVKREIKQLG